MVPTNATVFIVDDDPAVIASLDGLFRSQGICAESYSSAQDFLGRVDAQRPGCLLVDLRMPETSGIQLMQMLQARNATRPTVVITGNGDVESAVQAMKLGAMDFLQKPFNPTVLLETVQRALNEDERRRGHDEMRRQFLERVARLTPDERTVLIGMLRGLTNQQIADEMDVSLRTVQFRRSGLFGTLGVKTRMELIGLVERVQWSPEENPEHDVNRN